MKRKRVAKEDPWMFTPIFLFWDDMIGCLFKNGWLPRPKPPWRLNIKMPKRLWPRPSSPCAKTGIVLDNGRPEEKIWWSGQVRENRRQYSISVIWSSPESSIPPTNLDRLLVSTKNFTVSESCRIGNVWHLASFGWLGSSMSVIGMSKAKSCFLNLGGLGVCEGC